MQVTEYVEKQAAVEIAMQYCPDDDGSCSRAGEDIRGLLDELENLPPADVRPVVRGEWIGDGDCIICSNCKTAYTFMGSNFCPNCGADMRGGDADGEEKD